jgi:tetraacyldisaccharide 4'-kinase
VPQASHSPLARARDGLLARWFQPGPSWASALLAPLSWLYAGLQRRSRQSQERQSLQVQQPSCPVVVVGNLIVGGAGKTPTTLAVIEALRKAGHVPGVVSRGHGRQPDAVLDVTPDADPQDVGDEPLLIRRRSGAPVVVGRDRVAAANHLLQRHPQVDVIVSDDGLQHRRLRRDVEVVVFDERGVGNGRLLPAGPLREPFASAPPAQALVIYNHRQRSTTWPGVCAERTLSGAWPLVPWQQGGHQPTPLSALRGRPLLAIAGIAVPERFFAALEAAGLTIDRLPMPDHHGYATLPWPTGTRDVVTTEKDAVKLARLPVGDVRVWVVGLDLRLPAPFVADLLARVAASAHLHAGTAAPKGRL